MTLTVINGPIIQAGQSLSAAVDCTAGQLVRLTMPADWSEAVLTFEISSDNIGYNPLYQFGAMYEVTVPVIPGCGILVSEVWKGIQWVKFRSGTLLRPVVQPVQREFSVALWSA
jgi:hypothetical protein